MSHDHPSPDEPFSLSINGLDAAPIAHGHIDRNVLLLTDICCNMK